MRKLNLVGQRFGRLKVIADYGISGKHLTTWLCECDCGEQKIVAGIQLTGGKTRSCGCLLAESRRRNMAKKDRTKPSATLRHGHCPRGRGTRTFSSWVSMRQFCLNPKAPNYRFYGAFGVYVCERWRDSFDNFLADMGEKPEGTRLNRIDKSRGFEPSNCEWKLIGSRKGKKLFVAGAETVHRQKPVEWEVEFPKT